MAIVKKSIRRLRRERKRTTWTLFYLPRELDWPKWMAGHSNTYLGPLADVAGCEKVRLGRQVEDPEQATLIILWESAEALKDFQRSPLCGEFLRSLGCENENEPLLSFQYESGFCLGEDVGRADDLHGRITLTTLNISYTGAPDRKAWLRVIADAFGVFMPNGCEDLRGPPVFNFKAYAWADDNQRERSMEAGETSRGQPACYLFFRWNANCASPEREEASVRELSAHEWWAKAVAKTMPPVDFWERER